MQMQIFRRAVVGLMALGLTFSALAILSCGGNDENSARQTDTLTENATLTGAAERPAPVSSSGSGTVVLNVSADLASITYTLNYSGLTSVTQAHIHVGNENIAGPIIFYLCTNVGLGTSVQIGGAALPTPPACPTGSGTVSGILTEANLSKPSPTATPGSASTNQGAASFSEAVNQITTGNSYSNIHTVANGGGEIRGQNK